MTDSAMMPDELNVNLRSLEEFRAFMAGSPWFIQQHLVDARVNELRTRVVVEPLTHDVIAPGELEIVGINYRESLSHRQVASRHRAVLAVIEAWVAKSNRLSADIDVYAPESVTPFAARLRDIFPRFVGSEYCADEETRQYLVDVRLEDLTNLSFPDASFDIVCTNDVLEHVPSVDKSLSEIMRVLRPGGLMVSTHPFAAGRYKSVVRAELLDGRVVHHMPAEYHGNPVDPRGSLVFEVPGWDVIDRCRSAGASDAFVTLLGSTQHGIIGANEAAIYLTVAIR